MPCLTVVGREVGAGVGVAVGEDVTQKGQEAGSKVRQTMRRGWVAVGVGRAAQTHWASAVNSVCVTCSQDSQTTARVGEHDRR